MIQIIKVKHPRHMDLVYAIRREVFIEEQQVSEAEEYDGQDATATHILAWSGTQAVGTGRLRLMPEYAKLERIAVLAPWRGLHIGQFLVNELIKLAQSQGATEARLGSQTHAIGFYENLGFVAYGDIFDDAGIPHRMMKRALTQAA